MIISDTLFLKMESWWQFNIIVIGYIFDNTKRKIPNDIIKLINKFYGYKIIRYANGIVDQLNN